MLMDKFNTKEKNRGNILCGKNWKREELLKRQKMIIINIFFKSKQTSNRLGKTQMKKQNKTDFIMADKRDIVNDVNIIHTGKIGSGRKFDFNFSRNKMILIQNKILIRME